VAWTLPINMAASLLASAMLNDAASACIASSHAAQAGTDDENAAAARSRLSR
jgi:hypothetical protein